MINHKKINWLLTALIIITIIMGAITITAILLHRDNLSEKIQSAVKNEVKSLDIKAENGYTPMKGVDYFDGKDGSNGQNGTDGYTPVKGVDYTDGLKGEDGVNGVDAYIELRCNEIKNRWEVRYTVTETFQVLNGYAIKCTIPTIVPILNL